MLDLITMFAAVGAQAELDKVRKDTGLSSPLTSEAQEATGVSEQASTVETGINAVEDAAASVMNFMMPSSEMFTVLASETATPAKKA